MASQFTPDGILFKDDGRHLLCGIDIGIQKSMVISLLAIREKLKIVIHVQMTFKLFIKYFLRPMSMGFWPGGLWAVCLVHLLTLLA
jgi:hypothetical protein